MKRSLLDTDTISYILRNERNTSEIFKLYLDEYGSISTSIINHYEILSGLKYRDNKNFLEKYEKFVENINILNIDIKTVETSSRIYADLRKKGINVGQADILIAGICLAHKLALVTNNEKHYKDINGLEIENWSK